MRFTFLTASMPIVKTYTHTPNGLEYLPYPNVYEFTSHSENATDLGELHKLLNQYSKQNGCLLKGELKRVLVSESRAGSTDPDSPTEWVCLDVDGVENVVSTDQFLDAIGIRNTSHIVQWSSSMGIVNKPGLRCHIFILLDKATSPALLKSWLRGLNLNVPLLSGQLELTKTGNSLRWPLDITTCQNDKLIYIAPPALNNVVDPYPKNRITLEQRRSPVLFVDQLPIPLLAEITDKTDIKINEFRDARGMKKRTVRTRMEGTVEYQCKPNEATITSMKTERGFVYFNLNGGDSWGYYHPIENPTFIFNFKGEPAYKTSELLPSYWSSLKKQEYERLRPTAKADDEIFVLREGATTKYYGAIINEADGKVVLKPAKSEKQLSDFLEFHGKGKLNSFVPIYELVYDPQNPKMHDQKNFRINVYKPPTLKSAPGPWPTIGRLIHHVMGSDQHTTDHFLNWIAAVLQDLTNHMTAWIWQGTHGTGKGILYHQVLTPMFGDTNVVSKRMEELEEVFSGYMDQKILVFIDEMEQGTSLYHSKIESKLKNLITEPTISIRNMYTEARMAPNLTNMIFASNNPAPVAVRGEDRRFNVGYYQSVPLLDVMTRQEIELVKDEVPGFMDYLLNRVVDQVQARTPLISAARTQLIKQNKSAIDETGDAILSGDLEWIWDQLPSVRPSNPLDAQAYERYKALVIELVTHLPAALSREELRAIYDWTVGDMPHSPNKFTARLRHHRIHMESVWRNGRSTRGIRCTWTTQASVVAKLAGEISDLP